MKVGPVECMMPKWPAGDPVAHSPEFYTPPPKLHFLTPRLAITLGPVGYRDRYGRIWWTPPGAPVNGMSYIWPASWIWDRWAVETRLPMIMHDVGYGCHDHMRGWDFDRREIDFNIVDGLRLTDPEGARIRFLAVRLGGETMWREYHEDPLFVEWLAAVDGGDDELRKYMKKYMGMRG